jgi:hypothetical protein
VRVDLDKDNRLTLTTERLTENAALAVALTAATPPAAPVTGGWPAQVTFDLSTRQDSQANVEVVLTARPPVAGQPPNDVPAVYFILESNSDPGTFYDRDGDVCNDPQDAELFRLLIDYRSGSAALWSDPHLPLTTTGKWHPRVVKLHLTHLKGG